MQIPTHTHIHTYMHTYTPGPEDGPLVLDMATAATTLFGVIRSVSYMYVCMYVSFMGISIKCVCVFLTWQPTPTGAALFGRAD